MVTKTKGSRKSKATPKTDLIPTTEQMSENMESITEPTFQMNPVDASYLDGTADNTVTMQMPMTEPPLVNALDQEKILRVYRHKVFGKQVMYKVVEGKNQAIGITIIPTYRRFKTMEEQPDGSLIPEWHTDESMIIARTKHFDIIFEVKMAKDWMEQCQRDAINPQFLFKEGNRVITIRDRENFLGDFDKVMKMARKGEPV